MKDLTLGSIVKHLLAMAMAIAIGMLLKTLYFIVDLYFFRCAPGRCRHRRRQLRGQRDVHLRDTGCLPVPTAWIYAGAGVVSRGGVEHDSGGAEFVVATGPTSGKVAVCGPS